MIPVLEEKEILAILREYGVNKVDEIKRIDSSRGEKDIRLNYIVDKKYVLRINSAGTMTEERLQELERLIERYKSIGVSCPRFLRVVSDDAQVQDAAHHAVYSLQRDGMIVYLSEYMDYPLAEDVKPGAEFREKVVAHLGVLAKKYSGCDLMRTNSMWSLIDLAPLDTDVDEKQENLDSLVLALEKAGESKLARQAVSFNHANREKIKRVYKRLPRCVYQGDLNDTNILVENGEFKGLIDFNLAGTEVNINCFVNETASLWEKDFKKFSGEEIYARMLERQDRLLEIIFQNYQMNRDEEEVIENYRSICLIAQWPNVCFYKYALETGQDREKVLEVISRILQRDI